MKRPNYKNASESGGSPPTARETAGDDSDEGATGGTEEVKGKLSKLGESSRYQVRPFILGILVFSGVKIHRRARRNYAEV